MSNAPLSVFSANLSFSILHVHHAAPISLSVAWHVSALCTGFGMETGCWRAEERRGRRILPPQDRWKMKSDVRTALQRALRPWSFTAGKLQEVVNTWKFLKTSMTHGHLSAMLWKIETAKNENPHLVVWAYCPSRNPIDSAPVWHSARNLSSFDRQPTLLRAAKTNLASNIFLHRWDWDMIQA